MADTVDEIIENETFSTRILIATKVIDNGINIKDDRVKHIFIEFIYDTDIIQALGRLRIEKQRINLYIPDLNKKYFRTIMNDVSHNLNIVFDYFCFLDNNDYDNLGETEKKLIRMDYLNENSKGDLKILNNNGTLNKAKHICMEYFEMQLDTIKKIGYLKYVAELLYNNQHEADNFIKFENIDFKHALYNSLDSFLDNRMYKEDRKEFRKFLQENSMVNLVKRPERVKSMSLNTINKCFEELELPYIIKNIQDKDRSSQNYNKTYWVLSKLD